MPPRPSGLIPSPCGPSQRRVRSSSSATLTATSSCRSVGFRRGPGDGAGPHVEAGPGVVEAYIHPYQVAKASDIAADHIMGAKSRSPRRLRSRATIGKLAAVDLRRNAVGEALTEVSGIAGHGEVLHGDQVGRTGVKQAHGDDG